MAKEQVKLTYVRLITFLPFTLYAKCKNYYITSLLYAHTPCRSVLYYAHATSEHDVIVQKTKKDVFAAVIT
jgi:hypothetical protein